MDIKTTTDKINGLITQSKIMIIDFQEELLAIKEYLESDNSEENDILFSIVEDINFLVGTLSINCMKLEKLLTEIQADGKYIQKHHSEITEFLTKIENFNEVMKNNKGSLTDPSE